MPRKKSSCELCCDAIEKDHDILQCKGECGSTVHRYCAGVTKRQFEELSKGDPPFVCQWCSLKSASATIQQLLSVVEVLRTELATTKTTLANLQNERLQNPSRAQSYASVATRAATRNKKQRQQRPPGSQSSASSSTTKSQTVPASATATREVSAANSSPSTVASTRNSSNDQQPARVKVEGARRIWATHSHATVKTVENVISRFCNMQGLRIRRKTRRNGTSGRSTWWFVIHADEAVLSELDQKWDNVHVQTSWTLSQCTKPADTVNIAPASHPSSGHDHPPTPTLDNCEVSSLQQQDAKGEDTPGPVPEDVDTSEDPSFLDPTRDSTSAT